MKRLLICALCIITLLPMTWAAAQGGTTTLPDGSEVALPDGWTFEEQDDGSYYFSNGDAASLIVYPPDVIDTLAVDFETAPTLLVSFYVDVLDSDIDEANIVVNDDGAEYAFDDDGGIGVSAVVAWGDGLLFYQVYAPADDFEAARADADAILAQMAPASGGDCFVSTDVSWGAELRLGPGDHRGVYTQLMPADGEVLVLGYYPGQAFEGDQSWWYRVEEHHDGVEQLWVNAEDVTATGACDNLPEGDPQGVINPLPAPPAPAQPAGGDDDGGAPADSGGGQPANTALVPRAGTWAANFDTILNLSCEGTGNVRVDFSGYYVSGTGTLTISNAGQNLMYVDTNGWQDFTLVGPGTYQGYGDVDIPTGYAVFWLHVSSPTTMRGEMVVGMTDPPCSGTLNVGFTFIG